MVIAIFELAIGMTVCIPFYHTALRRCLPGFPDFGPMASIEAATLVFLPAAARTRVVATALRCLAKRDYRRREVQPFIGVMPCRGAFGTKDFIGSVIVDELAFGLVLIRPESQERRPENKNLTFRDGSIRRVVDGA